MPYQAPDLAEESALHDLGYELVAGIDEVGRGALAGDVVAAAVILPRDAGVLERLSGVRDSKQLTSRQRTVLCQCIQAEAIAIGVGCVSAPDIDRMGILAATRQAMMQAVANLRVAPRYLLIDAVALPELCLPQKAIIKGDTRCLSIAAASVMAKVFRDQTMAALDALYPAYGFARNKGYGTPFHRQALAAVGPCPIHRRSYAPVRATGKEAGA